MSLDTLTVFFFGFLLGALCALVYVFLALDAHGRTEKLDRHHGE
jgi:hypothetical protein